MKRLLLVTYFFPPAAGGGVARVLSFARHLPRHGWQVSVLCGDPEAAPLRDASRAASLPEGVDVRTVPMPAGLGRGRRAVVGNAAGGRPSSLYRVARALAEWALVPDSYRPWRAGAARAAAARLADGDITAVLTSSPPDTVHLVGLDAAGGRELPWIADFRDPWVGLTYKRPPTPLHALRQRRQRAAVLARADLVLASTRASAEAFRALLGPARAERVVHVPNGWEADVDLSQQAAGAAEETEGGPLSLVYTGTLWDVPATRTCFSGLARARAGCPGADLEVHIVGPHETAERRLAERLGLAAVVRFHGQLPYAEARARQASAGVLLLLQVHGPGTELAVPGKLYEYVASGRPILAFLKPGEAADLVREAGGWVAAPEDVRGAEEVFARLLRGGRPAGDSPARRAFADAHRRDRIAARLAGILDELIAARAGGGR